jgi:hypothetical protein
LVLPDFEKLGNLCFVRRKGQSFPNVSQGVEKNMTSMITRKPYKTDLTDEQWELLRPLLTLPDGGAPKTTDLREVINGIFYRLKTGCQ